VINLKSKKKQNIVRVLFLLVLFFVGNYYLANPINSKVNHEINNYTLTNVDILGTSGHWDLAPFVIDDFGGGDYTWEEASAETWCSGSGTWNDPYIIENVTINGLNASSCITISNSDVYFIIQNSTLYNASAGIEPNNNAGIKLENVSNGKILNNNCSNNWFGIYIDHGSNYSIIENNISYNHFHGIQTYESDYSYISGNQVIGNGRLGMVIDYSYESIIIGNTVTNNKHGILIEGTDAYEYNKSLVKNNNCSHNQGIGIILSSKHIDIIGNIANDNFYGIQISHLGDCFIYGNTANNNRKYGIFVNCDNNQIYYNNVSYNGEFGIYLYDLYSRSVKNNTIKGNIGYNNSASGIALINNCSFNNLSENKLSENYYGIYLGNSFNNTIFANIASNNYHFGIDLYQSENNTLSENIVKDNDNMGIELYESNYNIINDSVAINNVYAIYLYESNYNKIYGNNATDNKHNGIHLFRSHHNNISENLGTNNREASGISLSQSNFNEISGNDVQNNYDFGIFLEGSDRNIIEGNFAKINTRGIEIVYSDNNTLIENIVDNNDEEGIYIYQSNNNTVLGNIVKNNTDGLFFYNSNYTVVSGNYFKDNYNYGVRIFDSDSQYNIFYKNLFLGNIEHAIDNGLNNNWNNSVIGNYWDNYAGIDADKNGIGDTPHVFEGGTDYLPIYDRVPFITIYYPINGTHWNTRPTINIEAIYTNLDNIWYEVNGQRVFISSGVIVLLDNEIWLGLPEGAFIIKIYANDTYGHINDIYSLLLYKDTTAPILTINSPIQDQGFIDTPTFRITITELNLDTMWYVIVSDGTTKHIITLTTGSIDVSVWNSLTDGTITIRFYANDTAGNEVYSEVSIVKYAASTPTPGIPGFNVIITLSVIFLVSIVIIKRKKKLLNLK